MDIHERWQILTMTLFRNLIQVVRGGGEVFGTELVANKVYTFEDSKFAVFTWHGCEVEVSGKCEHAYISEETPMITYINIYTETLNKWDCFNSLKHAKTCIKLHHLQHQNAKSSYRGRWYTPLPHPPLPLHSLRSLGFSRVNDIQ